MIIPRCESSCCCIGDDYKNPNLKDEFGRVSLLFITPDQFIDINKAKSSNLLISQTNVKCA